MADIRKPVMLDVEKLAPVQTPQEVAPISEQASGNTSAMQRVALGMAGPAGWLSKMFWSAVLLLLGMAISLAAWDFVTGLLARNIWLGRGALLLVAVVIGVLVLITLRELVGFVRLRRIDVLRKASGEARESFDRARALAVLDDFDKLYRGRAELRWARGALTEKRGDILDADALIDLLEQQLMPPLDAAARREIEAASRQVAAATALVPLALVDVLVALTSNVAMIRRIAAVYGGRAGFIGSWRLLKGVVRHLVATGAVAIGDDMLGSMVGGGALSKISRRFGEGVINGTLTARVGVTAMEICRPMPFVVQKRPSVSSIVKSALLGLFK
ncbi:MAG: TIGR01620 family protein [Rhodobacteraceae bacterium]|nr:TIGR01620 family protein [Paracoccaceae bacterium]